MAILFVLAIVVSPVTACNGCGWCECKPVGAYCPTVKCLKVTGEVIQENGAGIFVGKQFKVDGNDVTVAGPYAAASGGNESSANYVGCKHNYCCYNSTLFGGALTVGATDVGGYISPNGKYASVKGITWNFSIAGHNGRCGLSRVAGSGELATGTFAGKLNKNNAWTYTNGTFDYTAKGKNLAAGGGVVYGNGTSCVGSHGANASAFGVAATGSLAH